MPQDEKLREKLITYLQDMHAVENHLVEVLGKQVQETSDAPLFQMKIQEHLEQTKQHRTRLEACLSRYSTKPSGGKSALTNILGSLQGVLSGTRPDALAMSVRDDYVSENFEIASYIMLIATAQAFGDQETVNACQLNLHDEVITAKWLEQHVGQAALLSLQKDGIPIAADTIQQEQTQVNGVLAGFWQEAEQMAASGN